MITSFCQLQAGLNVLKARDFPNTHPANEGLVTFDMNSTSLIDSSQFFMIIVALPDHSLLTSLSVSPLKLSLVQGEH